MSLLPKILGAGLKDPLGLYRQGGETTPQPQSRAAGLSRRTEQPAAINAPARPGRGPDWDDLVNTVIAEAGGEGDQGMASVAWVFRNRSERRGQTPGEVVRADDQFAGYSNPGAAAKRAQQDPALRSRASEILEKVFAGEIPDPTGGADHFHSGEAPYWAASMRKTNAIGGHEFYDSGSKARNADPSIALEAVATKMGAGTPGEIRRGPDGRMYQYAETTGMLGDKGGQGWIRVATGGEERIPGNPQAKGLARLAPPDEAPGEAQEFLISRLVGKPKEHVTGMQPEFQNRLAALIQAAPPEIAGKLGIFSGTRTVQRQTELWNAALKKYGSVEKARKWVAPPPGVHGSKGSRHNLGMAADLTYNGQSLAHAPKEVVSWLHQNAGQFGLAFPLGNENWHIELVEARGGKSPAGLTAFVSTEAAPSSALKGVSVDEAFKPSDPMGLYKEGPNPFAPPEKPAEEAPPIQTDDGSSAEIVFERLEQEEPGRYKLLAAEEVPTFQEQWQGENQSTGFLGDAKRLLGAGWAGLGLQVREAVRALAGPMLMQPGISSGEPMSPQQMKEGWRKMGDGFVATLDSIDEWMRGDGVPADQHLERQLEANIAGLTPETAAARQKQWWDSESNRPGAAWLDPRSYFAGITESLPSTVLTMGPSGKLAWGAFTAALGKGLSRRQAAAAAARTATIAGAVGEGIIGGGQTAQSVREQIMQLPRETLEGSESYQELLRGGMSHEQAVDALASDSATQAFMIGGLATGAFGGMGDRVLAKIIADGVGGSLVKRIVAGTVKGTVGEGILEEAPQEAAGQIAENLAVQPADPSRDVMEGVPEAAAGGLAVGGAMGAGMGAPAAAVRKKGPIESALDYGERFRVSDPAIEGIGGPGELDGQTVTAAPDQTGVPTGMRKVVTEAGAEHIVGDRLLEAAPTPAPEGANGEQSAPAAAASTAVPEGAPALESTVRVDAEGIEPFMARVQGYEGDEAILYDGATGELYQVPIANLTVLAGPPGSQSTLEPPPAEPKAGEIRTEMPPRDEQKPATSKIPALKPGDNVIVDDPAGGRFSARIESFEGDEALVVKDDGTPQQVPVKALHVSKLTKKEVEAQDLTRNPPVERDPVPIEGTTRKVGKAAVTMPDDLHARLFDVGVERRTTQKLLGATTLDLNATVPAAQRRIAKELGISDEAAGQLADDYRYRVERFAKQARSALPIKMHPINPTRLKQWQAQQKKAAGLPTDLDTWWDGELTSEQRKSILFQLGIRRSEKTPWAGFSKNLRERIAVARDPAVARETEAVGVHVAGDEVGVRAYNEKDKAAFRRVLDSLSPADQAKIRKIAKEVSSEPRVAANDEPAPVDVAGAEAATSPENDRPEPTEAQKEAGNYKLGHPRLGGLDLSIENPAGSTRSGTDKGGKAWSIEMKSHYGYIKGTKGRDKDHIDAFVKPGTAELADDAPIHVVDQVDADGKFDEHKVMLGWDDTRDAARAYNENYSAGWRGLGAITPTTLGEFKRWTAEGDTSRAYAKRNPKAAVVQAEDSDEAVEIRLTESPPWDFTETYPAPDLDKVVAAAEQGRDILGNGEDGARDVEQVVGVIEETLQELVIRNLDIAAAKQAIADIEAGKGKKGRDPAKDKKRHQESIADDERAIEDTGGALSDAWSDEAVDAIQAEAAKRAGQEQRMTDPAVERPRIPKEEREPEAPAAPRRDPVAEYRAAHAEADRRWPPRVETTGTGKKQRTNRYVTHEHIAFTNGALEHPPLAAMPINVTIDDIADAFDAGVEWRRAQEPKAAPTKPSRQAKPRKTTAENIPAAAEPAWGAGNKLVSRDRADEVRAKLKEKLRGQISSGIDPEILALGAELAAFHIEAGARRFADFARAIAEDMGASLEKLRPYLRSWYNGARDLMEDSGADIAGTDDAEAVRAALEQLFAGGADGKPQELDRDGSEALAGAPAGDVRRDEGGRNARKAPRGGGQPDLFGGQSARAERPDAGGSVGNGEGRVSAPAAGEPATEVPPQPDQAPARTEAAARDSVDASDSAAVPAQNRAADFTITEADAIGRGGAKTKFRQNVAAIRLLRELEKEPVDGEVRRVATRDEQAVLAKWVGWGGLQAAFPREDGSVVKGWDKEAAELRELLSDDEYRAAEASTRNAHYTSPEVVEALWKVARRLGFAGGQVLEPSVGAGNFIGLMPGDLRQGSRFTGVELDAITGGIAKHLYPGANIQAPMGFQSFNLPDGHFDLAIGNPPFGSEKIYDGDRREISGLSIHNYFFAKSIDALKPGGVLAMVVTNFFLDAQEARTRKYIASKADLLGAIRLPNTAFLANAGTEVTTDIIILRKRKDGEQPGDSLWTAAGMVADPAGPVTGRLLPLNSYFAMNRDMMLGQFGGYGTMYGRPGHAALIARDGDDLPALLDAAIAKLPRDVMDPPGALPVQETVTVPDAVKDALVGSLFLAPDGTIYVRDPDNLGEPQATAQTFASQTAADRVAGMIRVRDAFARLRRAQIDESASDEKVEELRDRLNKFYDAFAKKHGPINQDVNKRLFRDDPTWPQISALEQHFDKGVSASVAKSTGEIARAPSAQKAPIFTKRTQQPYRRPTSAASAKDALATVLADRGRVDLDAMQRLYRKSHAEMIGELGPLLYQAPGGGWETADAYLSGNVKKKLAEAEAAAKSDPAFQRNVAALRDVIPADIEAVDIDAKAGAPWVPARYIVDFIHMIADKPPNAASGRAVWVPAAARWSIEVPRGSDAADAQWGTSRADVKRVLDAAINHQTITIYDRVDDKEVVNREATDAANEKVAKVKAEWRRWIWEDDARRETLVRIYNDTFNTDVMRAYDGSHLTLPGKVGDEIISLRPHQKNFIWRVLQSSTTLADHVVGAGKTFAMIAAAMELRRTGQARKPMFVVPNHLVGQWAADFIRLYPGAKILAATKKDFDAENRKRLFARVAAGDWDAVIVAHSSFGRIGVDPKFEERFIRDQINDIEQSEKALVDAGEKKGRNVKGLAKRRATLEEKLKKLLDAGAKDVGMTFDELGIDALFVDEAHEFKNLGYSTSMYKVAGLGNTTGSQKAADLFMKIASILERTGGRNVVFATGTPLSNTMAEMFTVQRYLDNKALRDMGIAHFDAWARVFGEVVTDWELSPSGQYKLNSRFAKFVNMPELMQRYRSFADVISNDDIKAMLAAQGKTLPLPKVKGGKPQNIVVERSADQAAFIGVGTTDAYGNLVFPKGSLVWRAENLPKKPEPGADNMLKVMSDARKAALDMRLINPAYPDVPGSKVHVAADNIGRLHQKWNAKRGTQLVFIDLSTPKKAKAKEQQRILELMKRAEEGDESAQETLDGMSPDEFLALDSPFSVYDDLRDKLIARGIPAAEIAFIHDANTDAQKEELFSKVRAGRVRILFGSTAKMGAGTNVQNLLVGLHHLDAPWRPSDLEQRDGRGIRQGNELYMEDPEGFELEILRYATKNTLDARQWQTIEGKARFIGQVRKGGMKLREIEDIAGEASNAAEMKAAASGNPLILEEMDLRQKVRKLEAASVEHDREQHRIKMKLRDLANERSWLEGRREAAAEDAKFAKQFAFPFQIVGQQQVEKPKDLGEAIIAVAGKAIAAGTETAPLGKVTGFSLRLDNRKDFLGNPIVSVVIKGAEEHTVNVDKLEDADPVGTGMRVINTIRRLADTPGNIAERLGEIARQVPSIEKQIGPWADANQLEDTTARHREVLNQLRPKQQEQQKPVPKDAQPQIAPDADPVTFLTGHELGVRFASSADMPGLRRAAVAWYDKNLRGSTALMADGSTVTFSRKGMGKVTSQSKGDLLLRSVPAIRAIIEKGTIVRREPGRNIDGERIIIVAPIQIGELRLELAVSVHKTGERQYHYDLTFDTGDVSAAPDGEPSLTEGERSSGRPLPSVDVPQTDRLSFNLVLWTPEGKQEAPAGWGIIDGGADENLLSEADQEELTKIIRDVAGLSDVEWQRRIVLPKGAPGWGSDAPSTAVGYYSPSQDAVTIAMNIAGGQYARRVAFHEAFHRLQRLFLTAEERAVLKAERARLRRIVAGQFGRERQAGVMSQHELEAEAFGIYATGEAKARPHKALAAAWDRIVEAVRRVRNWLAGRGFQTAEDVFNRAMAGETKALPQNPAPVDFRSYSVAPPDAEFSLTEARVVEEVKGRLTDLSPTLLAAVPLNYFPELARAGMDSVREYLRVKRLLDAYRGKKHAAADTIAQAWLKFARLGFGKDGKARAAELADLMHSATLAGIDPTKTDAETRLKPGYNDLRGRLMKLPPSARQLFQDVRDAYRQQADELDAILLDNVRKAQEIAQRRAEAEYREELARIGKAKMSQADRKKALEEADARYKTQSTRAGWSAKARLTKLRIAFEASRVPEPYFPLARFGRYFVTVRDVDGTVLSFSRREKAADRNRLAAEMRKAFPTATVEVGVMEDAANLRSAMDPRLVAEIEQIVGGAGLDGKTTTAVLDQIWQRYLQTMPDLSARKRFIHRKGTAGFDSDALRAFTHHMFHAAHQMGRLKYGLELGELVNQTVDEARKADDPTKAMTLANELKKRHDWVMNPVGGKVAQIMTSAAFVWYLGTTPAAAAVNMAQTPMLGIPILGARFGMGKAAVAIAKASADSIGGRGSVTGAKLKPDEKRALEAFYESGLIDRTQSHDLAGVGETGVEYSPLRARVMAVMSFLFHRAEVWNREVTALAAYRMARQAGQDQTAAIEMAHDLTWKVHFDYANSSRPRMLQSDTAKVVFVFRAHNINMLYRLFRDIHQAFKGQSPQARKEARYQLAGIVGMMGLFAGVTGLAGFNIAMALAGLAFGDSDDPFDFEQEFRASVLDILGPQLGGVVLNGAPGHLLGIDLTSRIGMPDLWFRSPSRDLQGEDEFEYWVMNSLGASVSMVGDVVRGVRLIDEGNVQRGLETLAPKWARDLMKAYRHASEGMTTLAGDEILPAEEFDVWDTIAQAVGFTPAKVAESYERNNALKNAEQRLLERRRRLVNAYAMAALAGDDDARKEVVTAIEAFNDVPYHKPLRITPETLRQSLTVRKRNAARREDGVLIQNERLGKALRARLPERVY